MVYLSLRRQADNRATLRYYIPKTLDVVIYVVNYCHFIIMPAWSHIDQKHLGQT